MRKAKLWSVILAAMLLCICAVGMLFTGVSASDSRIPEATDTYAVGTDGDTIRACLEKAAGRTWGATDVLEIQFTGSDSSAYAKPDAANGVSGYILFEVPTIFREDNTKLPIVIRGMDENRASTILTAENTYCSANDFYFTNLTMNGGSGVTVNIYAGCGKLVFENTTHKNLSKTYYFGDNLSMDAYRGWDAAKIAANQNEKGLIETGITFGNGCTGLYVSGASHHFSGVGYNGDATTNPVIFPLKRTASSVTAALTDAQVQAVREAAPLATFKPGNIITADCPVRPWDTAAHLILDCGNVADKDDDTPDYSTCGARHGVSPVREATIEVISGGVQYLSAGDTDTSINETYAGDTKVILRGGRSGEKTAYKSANSKYSDVGLRLTQVSMYVGNMTLEIHQDDPDMPTYTPWIQATNSSSATSTIFGDYHFLMTGGTIGRGHSIVDSDGNKVYNDGNDGYWGAPQATGSIVNEVRGGQIWAFYGSRYANSRANTPISTVLPGTGETLTAKVTVHNIISGGIIGGEKISGTGAKDTQSGTKGFFGQCKGSIKLASVCNEISGGTIYRFNGANSTVSSTPGDIYNFISGTADHYPTFLTHFYGSGSTVTTGHVTNVIKGYPVFRNSAGEKMSIYGGCRNGTVTTIDNYLGGMPVFDDFYGGCAGTAPGTDQKESDFKGVAGTITTTVAMDMPDTKISNYVWGGNGYHSIKGVDGWTADSKGNSENTVTGSIICNIYSAHFGTFRAESACGKIDNVPITVNIYGGKWSSPYMPVNRNVSKSSTAAKDSVVTSNIYGGEFLEVCYMGGQNANNRVFINNVYGGTFKGTYYGGGNIWVGEVTNNIYGGTWSGDEVYWYGGGLYCGSRSITNNIYGGTFGSEHDFMGAYANPETESNIYADQTIENNFYGGDFGSGWLYCGHRTGTTATITTTFHSGKDNPARDPENALYKYYNAATMKEGGTYLHDQVVCGSGYSESSIDVSTAESITNTFKGGIFTKATGGFADITVHGGMRWGIVGDVTNNFVTGNYFRVYGGCDYGRVTGTVTNNYGSAPEEGSEAPVLTFSGYVFGGGYDQTNSGSIPLSEKITAAKAAASPTAVQQAWIAVAAAYGDDFEGGAEHIVNNLYYGTFHQFFGGAFGIQSDTTRAISDIDTIVNNVYGGTFDKLGTDGTVFAGGCFRNAVIGTGITNNVYGGTFNGNWYGGSIGTGTVSCSSITNAFYGGEGNKSANASVYLGNGAPTFNGVVKSVIYDFTAHKSYVMGGSTNIHNQPEGALYAIETEIRGGTFSGFWGLGGGGSCELNGNVKTTVLGGTFNPYSSTMPNALMGGPRNGTLNGNIELIINGGTFNADVVGGTVWGSQSAACDTIDGSIRVTVTGGSFKDIHTVSRYGDDLKLTGTAILSVEQNAEKTLRFNGTASIDSLTATGDEIELGKFASLEVKSLTGNLCVKQAEGWIARDYLILPAGASYTVLESADCFGKYGTDDSIRVYGLGIDAAGATIILDTRLGARILFNKAEVDAIGDAFEVTVKLGDKVLATATYEDLVEYRGYYSMIVNGIGVTDMATDFTVSGQASLSISMLDLVQMGQKTWSGKWLELCNALENFHKVYNLDQPVGYAPEAVADEMTARRGNAGAQIYSATAGLLMTDAAGVRLTMILRQNPVNPVVTVNGNVIENCVTVTETKIGGTTYYETQIDLYFKAGAMEDVFEIVVSSDLGTYMTYGDTVARIAYQLASDADNENADNAAALLYYVQKACACASAL